MASVSTHPNESIIAITPVTTGSVPKAPNIKRHVQLYRYGKTGLLGKKGWKESNVIIYDDSTFKIFKDAEGHKTSVRPLKLEDVALDLAFGKAAAKYGPPPIVGDEHNYIAPNNFIAVPETKERNKIHWFAAKDEIGLNEIMHVIAETVAGKVRPPQMGKGAKGRYFTQDENEKWVTYWHSQQHHTDAPEESTQNGEPKGVSLAHPIIATPAAIPILPPSDRHGKHNANTIVMMELPKSLGSLQLEPDGLLEEDYDMVPHIRLVNGRRIKENVVVRKPQTQHAQASPPSALGHSPAPLGLTHSPSPPSALSHSPTPPGPTHSPTPHGLAHSPTPPKYATSPAPYKVTTPHIPPKPTPSPTPIIIKPSPSPKPIHHDYKNGSGYGSYSRGHSSHTEPHPSPYKSEISTYVVGEPGTTTMNIAITPPVKESFTQHQEREEVVTDRQTTVINVGTSERTISTVDNTNDGMTTFSTTKHSSFHRSTVTTTTDD